MKCFFEINLNFIFYQKVVDFILVINLKLMVMILIFRKYSFINHVYVILGQEIMNYNINFSEFDHYLFQALSSLQINFQLRNFSNFIFFH